VLVVEDQDSLRTVVIQALTQKGYRVSIAANGEKVLQVASALSEPIQALVTDVVMPGMAVPELAARLVKPSCALHVRLHRPRRARHSERSERRLHPKAVLARRSGEAAPRPLGPIDPKRTRLQNLMKDLPHGIVA
jgi:CheY-like chemotaxis protein